MHTHYRQTIYKTTTLSKLALMTLTIATLGFVGCEGDTGPRGPQGPEGIPGETGGVAVDLPAVDKLVQGLGGQAGIEALSGYRVTASGSRLLDGEGFDITDLTAGNTYRQTLSHDMSTGQIRVDIARDVAFLGFGQQEFSWFLTDDGGWVDGADSFVATNPNGSAMASPRIGAIRRELELFYPHILIQRALADDSLVDAGLELLDGAVHHVLTIEHRVAPIKLLVHAGTGRVSKLETLENDYLRRDLPIEIFYADWTDATSEPSLPRTVWLASDGEVLLQENRTVIEVNPTFAADTFTPPADAVFSSDQAEVVRGERNTSSHMNFVAAGLGLDVPALSIIATPVFEDNGQPVGVWHITGDDTRHNSLIVEQSEGVVIMDAPVHPERGDLLVQWVADNIGKPITHLIVSHHHFDHSSGVRAVAAAGADVVVFNNTAEFFAQVLRRPSTLIPDTLASSPVNSTITTVASDGSLLLDDSNNPIAIYHLRNPHSSDMLLPVVSNQQTGESVAFVVDLWNPGAGGGFPDWAQAVARGIEDTFSLDTNTLSFAGGHGGIGPYSELTDFLANLP